MQFLRVIKKMEVHNSSEERNGFYSHTTPKTAPRVDNVENETLEIDACLICGKRVKDGEYLLWVDVSPSIQYIRDKKFRICHKCHKHHYAHKIVRKKREEVRP